MTEPDTLQGTNRKLIRNLLLTVVGMFGFGFALVPLYDVICEVTGLNGRTSEVNIVDVPEGMEADEERTVRVSFVTRGSQGIPWDFEPEVRRVEVHPGEIRKVNFRARNTTGEPMVGQMIPSLAPGQAASSFMKTQCFCFDQQPLGAGAEESMPMVFYLDPSIPDHVEEVTLSYTLFDITDRVDDPAAAVAAR